MEKTWKDNGCHNMTEFFQMHGINPDSLLNLPERKIDFSAAHQFMLECKQHTDELYIVGDYDVDGITSTEILRLIATGYQISKIVRRIPKRFTEGYGLNSKIIEEIPDNAYMITVDNGVVAFDAIEEAKKRGIKVMVMDHHLPATNEDGSYHLPNADVFYDMHATNAEFKDYCAAGLVLKFAEYLWGRDNDFINYLTILAAFGTIADVVSMTDDNRRIVKNGLYLLNHTSVEKLPGAVSLIKKQTELNVITASDVSFSHITFFIILFF